jgi:hypothetical protein
VGVEPTTLGVLLGVDDQICRVWKTGMSGFLFRTIQFWQHQGKTKYGIKLKRFEDQVCFEAWKMSKRYQESRMEEIQAKSRSRKNWTVQFWILEYPVFSEQIESE